MIGRFAPSPTGPLHLGNLRTGLIAWLSARSAGGRFLVRVEDLDPVTSSVEHERGQLDDLRRIGIEWDGEPVRQSERFGVYHEAIGRLVALDRTYECFCSRREIRQATLAPHDGVPDGAYPGTCRDLTEAERARRRRDRRPALRLLTNGESISFVDRVAGRYVGAVDDVVIRRNDGVPAYNLAVVVDDALQRVTEVVRGDDLLSSTPRQILLGRLLGFPSPEYGHVPLVYGHDGVRLAKRHGPVSLTDLLAIGHEPHEIRAALIRSFAATEATSSKLLTTFDLAAVAQATTTIDLPRR